MLAPFFLSLNDIHSFCFKNKWIISSGSSYDSPILFRLAWPGLYVSHMSHTPRINRESVVLMCFISNKALKLWGSRCVSYLPFFIYYCDGFVSFFNLTILLTHSNYDGEELKTESHLANFSDIFWPIIWFLPVNVLDDWISCQKFQGKSTLVE